MVVSLMAVSLTLALAPAEASTPGPPPASAVHGHYVVLGQSAGATVAYARAVIEPGYACPALQAASGATSAGDSSVDPSTAMVTRGNPHAFPVIVCEARVEFDTTYTLQLDGATLELPRVRRNPARLLGFGDTGCKAGAASEGKCPWGTPAEPLKTLADAAAAGPAPDLIVHVGDYNYRGTPGPILFSQIHDGAGKQVAQWPYDAGDDSTAEQHCEQDPNDAYWDMNASNANYPDHWAAWRDDFFTPLAALLPKAPWIFARGNHELCSRAGPGYFYFLDPASNLAPEGQRSCPTPDPRRPILDKVVLADPYVVDLGTFALLVVDSANACDYFSNDAFTAQYRRQLGQATALLPPERPTWLVSHRPMWGLTQFDSDGGTTTGCRAGDDTWGCVNKTLQAASSDGATLPAQITLLLAGHMHRFQSTTFAADDTAVADDTAGRAATLAAATHRAPTLVIGNGGVALDDRPPAGTIQVTIAGQAAQVLSLANQVQTPSGMQDAFGYLDATLASDGGWSGTIVNPARGLTLAECGSARAAQGSVCELASGVQAAQFGASNVTVP